MAVLWITAGCKRLRIRQYAATRAGVEGVTPQRLDRESVRAECDGRRRTLTRRDPGALITYLCTRSVKPAAARKRVADAFSHFVAADDGDARVRTEAVEVGAAACARVRDVRQIRVGNSAIGRTGGAVPGAVLGSEPGRVVSGRRGDHVLGVGAIAEMRGSIHCLRRKLRLRRTGWGMYRQTR